MREQVFNDVLESKFVERVYGCSGPGFVIESGFEEVPILELQFDVVVVETCIAYFNPLDPILIVRLVVPEVIEFTHRCFVVGGSENQIHCKSNHLESSHANQLVCDSVSCE